MRRWMGFACFCLLSSAVLAEIGDRLYLAWLAPDEILLRYGTPDQIAARGYKNRFVRHQFLGYIPTPSWTLDKDRHNELGFRGQEMTVEKPPGVFRIACLGGSTTYGISVDNAADSYPGALQTELRRRGRNVEVINAGVPGWSSLQSLLNFEARVIPLSPDAVVVYHGVNDVTARLVWPHSAYRRDESGHVRPPERDRRWWEYSSVLRTVAVSMGWSWPMSSLWAYGGPPPSAWNMEFWRQVQAGEYPSGFFKHTPVSEILTANPPVFMEENLRDIVTLARAHGATPILATWTFSVPALRGVDLRLGTPEYQSAVAEQNRMIRRLADELGVTLWDLAEADIPPEEYVDGSHFNGVGNHHRAALLADLMESKLEGGSRGQSAGKETSLFHP